MEETKTNSYLATEPIGKLIMKFSIPCVLSMLVSALYNIVDQIFIGQSVGYLGNAATNVVYPFTVVAFGTCSFNRRRKCRSFKPFTWQRRLKIRRKMHWQRHYTYYNSRHCYNDYRTFIHR